VSAAREPFSAYRDPRVGCLVTRGGGGGGGVVAFRCGEARASSESLKVTGVIKVSNNEYTERQRAGAPGGLYGMWDK